MNSVKTSVIVTTAYLFLYVTLINIGISPLFAGLSAIFWPFTFFWMIFCILKDDKFDYPELKSDEEWGYRDKNRDELGII